MPSEKKPKLIYLAGSGRSGTTLLGALLSEAQGAVGVGEPAFIFTKNLNQNICTCEKKLEDCDFWGAILREDFQTASFQEAAVPGQRSLLFVSQVIGIMLGRKDIIHKEYLCQLKKLYTAVYRASGAEVIIDESKSQAYLFALKACDFFDLRVVHVLRDPRAVAFSWQRKKVNGNRNMGKLPWHISARVWLAQQFLFLFLPLLVPEGHYQRVRYEDFIEEPKTAFGELLEKTGLKVQEPVLSDSDFQITHINHFILSNISPPKLGENKFYKDMEWQKSMPFSAKMLVTLICWPMMLVYGYPIFWGRASEN